MQRTRELAREQGYVETVFGRRLLLPDIRAASGPRRAGAERAAINAPMQGTAADLDQARDDRRAGSYLDREQLATRLILQVHDELVLEVAGHGGGADRIASCRGLMTSVATLRVPLMVDVGHRPELGAGALDSDASSATTENACATPA